ncbi:MAG: hypothetical protein WED10_01360 [Brumimicrobium sp.]
MKNYFQVLIVVSIAWTFSFCSNEKSTETVNLDEFLPKSERSYDYSEDSINNETSLPPDSIQLIIQSKIPNAAFLNEKDTRIKTVSYFPDRLDYKAKFVNHCIIDSATYQIITWEFEDSLHTVNAFYNWMDCFGKNCESITLGETKILSEDAFELFIDDISIIYITSNQTISHRLWSSVFKPKSGSTWNYNLLQQPNRKVNWIGFEKN